MILAEKRAIDAGPLLKALRDSGVRLSSEYLSRHKERLGQHATECSVLLLLLGRLSEAGAEIEKALRLADDYFNGNWNVSWQECGHQYTRTHFRERVWQTQMLESVTWAMVLGRWDSAKGLLDFVGSDLGDYTEPDRKAFWIALRDFVSGKPKAEFEIWLERSRKATSKSHVLVQAAFDALVDSDAVLFQQCILNQFSGYAKRNRKPKQFPDAFNWWGSILYHLARHRGISVTLPEFESEFLLSLDQPAA